MSLVGFEHISHFTTFGYDKVHQRQGLYNLTYNWNEKSHL